MNRKMIIGLAAVIAVVVGGGLVWAFWSADGEAEGSGTLDSGTAGITLTVEVEDGLFPGGDSVVSFTASNDAEYDVTIGTLELQSVTVDAAGCDPDDFSMADVLVNQEIASGAENVDLEATGTLVFNDTSVSQDSCKGAELTLSVATK
jgi:hypothetical protein